MNSIKNCPVTAEDIDLAEKIYGHDVVFLRARFSIKFQLQM